MSNFKMYVKIDFLAICTHFLSHKFLKVTLDYYSQKSTQENLELEMNFNPFVTNDGFRKHPSEVT